MAKDVKKTQKNTVKKEESKKQPKKVVKKEKKEVISEVVETKKVTKEAKPEKEVVKKEKKNVREKLVSTANVFDNNRKAILFCIVGFLLATLLFRFILWPDRIATLSDGTQPVVNINGEAYTADKLYEEMKEYYSLNVLLNTIDDIILSEKYPENSDMTTKVKETAENYYSYYSSYYTKEQFLSNYGFKSEKQFLESLTLDYRRNEYFEDYAVSLVSDDEINKYYEEDVFGDVDSNHILVKVAKNDEEGLTDAEAKKLAQEIIKKLDSGKTWDEVTEEYKDKITSQKLGYNPFNASFDSAYLEECKKLEVGKYSKTPVRTKDYGYHIIYKVAQKDKPTLEEVKDDVIEILTAKKKDADDNLYYKALIVMREEAKLEFVDTVFGDEYKEYTKQYK